MKPGKIMVPVLILLFLLPGCGRKGVPGQEPLVSFEVFRGDLAHTLTLKGVVVPHKGRGIYPDVSGRISEIIRNTGSLVTRGTVLAYIDISKPGAQFKPFPLKAPSGGILTSLEIKPGDQVEVTRPVGIVSYTDDYFIALQLPEEYISLVKEGDRGEVSFPAYKKNSFQAEVKEIDSILNPSRGTAEIRLLIENPEQKILPGMSPEVTLILEKREGALQAPLSAVVTTSEKTLVYLLGANGRPDPREVELGMEFPPMVEILSGVEEKDLLVKDADSLNCPGCL